MDRMDIKTRSSTKIQAVKPWNAHRNRYNFCPVKLCRVTPTYWWWFLGRFLFGDILTVSNPTEATSVSSEFFVTRKLVGDLGEITWDPALKGA